MSVYASMYNFTCIYRLFSQAKNECYILKFEKQRGVFSFGFFLLSRILEVTFTPLIYCVTAIFLQCCTVLHTYPNF